MSEQDTISPLIREGWPGSACDKPAVINFFWVWTWPSDLPPPTSLHT